MKQVRSCKIFVKLLIRCLILTFITKPDAKHGVEYA